LDLLAILQSGFLIYQTKANILTVVPGGHIRRAHALFSRKRNIACAYERDIQRFILTEIVTEA
jgi:hypothetical protein